MSNRDLFAGGILSRDSRTVAPKAELAEAVFKHTVGVGIPGRDGLVRATGTLVNIRGHLRIATARHVVEAMYRGTEGEIAISGYRLLQPYQPTASHAVTGDAEYFKVRQIQLPQNLATTFQGEDCPFPDVGLIELEHTFEIARYTECWGGVLTPPIHDVMAAIGYPAHYQDQCVCVIGDDPEVVVEHGIRLYLMQGLSRGTLVRVRGASAADHQSLGGMSGGGLWAYIPSLGWTYVGVVFFESGNNRADVIYSTASNELTQLFKLERD
jgi:hypothetical protein